MENKQTWRTHQKRRSPQASQPGVPWHRYGPTWSNSVVALCLVSVSRISRHIGKVVILIHVQGIRRWWEILAHRTVSILWWIHKKWVDFIWCGDEKPIGQLRANEGKASWRLALLSVSYVSEGYNHLVSWLIILMDGLSLPSIVFLEIEINAKSTLQNVACLVCCSWSVKDTESG